MFCANCGREMKESIKFCPECGAPVDMTPNLNTNMDTNLNMAAENIFSERKLYGTGNYETLRQMTGKAEKVRKIFNVIMTILLIMYAYLMIRGLSGMLASVLEGQDTILHFAFNVFAVILFTCALLHIGLDIVLPILQKTKMIHAEEYLKCIVANDRRALMHALGQMKCSVVKSVYMDEHGEVCAAGKKSKHIFTIENETLMMTSQKDNYKAVLERETIAACLLKFLVPEAPINALANEKSNLRLSRMKLLLSIAAFVCGIIAVVIAIIYGTGNNYINMVKNGSPEAYSNITYGDAFDAFFHNCEWQYFESEDKRNVVEFHGDCMYGDNKVKVLIQFVVNKEQGTFHVWTAAIDGEEQPELIYSLMLLSIFENYGEDSQKGYLQLDDNLLTEKEMQSYKGEAYLQLDSDLSNEKDTQLYEDEVYNGEESVYNNDFDDDWSVEEFVENNVIAWEDVKGLAGRWSDGTIEISISIYTDADTYYVYSEVGTFFYGEILGTLYFLEGDENSWYLIGELAQGDEFTLQYWGGDEFKIIEASEGLRSVIGTTLYCQERYES